MKDAIKISLPLVTVLLLVALWGCGDARQDAPKALKQPVLSGSRSYIAAIKGVQFEGQLTQVRSVNIVNGVGYLTGAPFTFMTVNFNSNPELPVNLFAAAKNQDTFPNGGIWDPLPYGIGGLTLIGGNSYAMTSGGAGITQISLANISQPIVGAYYPPQVVENEFPQNLDFVCSALIAHPTLPIAYCMQTSGYIHTLSLSNGVELVRRDSYSEIGPSECCVKNQSSAAVFNGHLWITTGQNVYAYPFTAGGQLTTGIRSSIPATAVMATENNLYIHVDYSQDQQGKRAIVEYGKPDSTGEYPQTDVFSTNFVPVLMAMINSNYMFFNIDNAQFEVWKIYRQ